MTTSASRPANDASVVASWQHEGLAIQACIESRHVTLETRIVGLRGCFSLAYRDDDDAPHVDAWTEGERHVLLSAHCILESNKAHDEVARFQALPTELRACMVQLCETRRLAYIDFEDEILSFYLGMTNDGYSAESCAEHVPTLAAIARALPAAFKSAPDAVVRRYECSHCRHVVFLVDSATCCSRCGAPAA